MSTVFHDLLFVLFVSGCNSSISQPFPIGCSDLFIYIAIYFLCYFAANDAFPSLPLNFIVVIWRWAPSWALLLCGNSLARPVTCTHRYVSSCLCIVLFLGVNVTVSIGALLCTDNLISHFSSLLIFILLAQAGGKAVPPTPTSPADWEVSDNKHHSFYMTHLNIFCCISSFCPTLSVEEH